MPGWEQLRPLWELLRLVVLSHKYLQADVSPIKVLDRDHENGVHKGYMWLYRAPVDRLVLLTTGKAEPVPAPGFKGILQTDGYIVYDSLYADHPDILLTYCIAHARRYFVNVVKDDGKQANYVLDEMQLLYALEKRMREQGLDWEKRTAERMKHAVPVLNRLGKWLKENRYLYRSQSQWEKPLTTHCPGGRN